MTAALFVEGSQHLDLRRRDHFVELWGYLTEQTGFSEARVVPISKSQIVALSPPPKWRTASEPLDLLIDREFNSAPFDNAIVVFDTEPKHDRLTRKCRRNEVLELLNGLAASNKLPDQFRDAAAGLVEHYESEPRPPQRPAGRPPRGCLEVVAMEPAFEALLLADYTRLKTVLGITPGARVPAKRMARARPDRNVLDPMVEKASATVRRKVRGGFLTNKHAWASYILRGLPNDSVAWDHAIVERLRLVAD